MEPFLNLLSESYFGNTLYDYLVTLGVIIIFLLFVKILKNRVFQRLKVWSKKTKTDIDDEIIKNLESVPSVLYFFIALYIGLQFVVIHPVAEKVIEIALVILVIYWATKVVTELIEYFLHKFAKEGSGQMGKNTTYFALTLIARIILWSTGLLLVLSNLGVNISALIASLGIGGIAVALAIQNILGDIFSSFSIYLDKPFEVGDFIIVGEHMGTVKKIGLKTTRIQALAGEEIVIANNELTSSRIQNYKKMKKRRIQFAFGVTYDTAPAKLKKIPKLVKAVIKAIKLCTFDRTHLKRFGDSSLDFEVVYYLDSADYNKYMDTQQKINLGVIEAFKQEGIDMAFPTRSVHLHTLPEMHEPGLKS